MNKLLKTLFIAAFGAVVSVGASADDIQQIRARAEKGDVDAYVDLGIMYTTGQGVKQSDKEAAKWFHKAEKKGSVAAKCYLGTLYYYGFGIEKDKAKAKNYLQSACNDDFELACKFLLEKF